MGKASKGQNTEKIALKGIKMKQNFSCTDPPYIQNCSLGYHELLWLIMFCIDQLYLKTTKLQVESQEKVKVTLTVSLS